MSRKVILCVVLLLLAVGAGYLFWYEPPYQGLLNDQKTLLVFSHRGFGNHAPDNSLEGAEIALSQGFDGVDVDAQFSKDKEVVIFHDVSLERFTNGEGRVDSKTLAELQTYDLGAKYGNGFSHITIKTFEDFVQKISPHALVMVELKISSIANTGMEERVNEIIAHYDAYDRVYISSFNPVVLYRLKHINPRIKTVFIFMDTGWDPQRVAATKTEDRVTLPWYLRTEWTRTYIRKVIRPDAVSIQYQVDESVIDKLLAKGYPVFLWPVNDESAINFALKKNPYGLVTDEPPLTKKLRDSYRGQGN